MAGALSGTKPLALALKRPEQVIGLHDDLPTAEMVPNVLPRQDLRPRKSAGASAAGSSIGLASSDFRGDNPARPTGHQGMRAQTRLSAGLCMTGAAGQNGPIGGFAFPNGARALEP